MMADQKGDRRDYERMNLQLVPIEDEGFVRFFECPTDGCDGLLKLDSKKKICDHCEMVAKPRLQLDVLKPATSERQEAAGDTDSDGCYMCGASLDDSDLEGFCTERCKQEYEARFSDDYTPWVDDPFDGPFDVPDGIDMGVLSA